MALSAVADRLVHEVNHAPTPRLPSSASCARTVFPPDDGLP